MLHRAAHAWSKTSDWWPTTRNRNATLKSYSRIVLSHRCLLEDLPDQDNWKKGLQSFRKLALACPLEDSKSGTILLSPYPTFNHYLGFSEKKVSEYIDS